MNKAERQRLEKLATELQEQIREAETELTLLRVRLEEPDFVSVVYVRASDKSPMLNRSAFAYYNGIGDMLAIGDRVIAPTRYNPYAEAIVVSLTQVQDDGYSGPFLTIREFA